MCKTSEEVIFVINKDEWATVGHRPRLAAQLGTRRALLQENLYDDHAAPDAQRSHTRGLAR